jgi:hypothetical protein
MSSSSLPNWIQLFGPNANDADAGRSVTSPAAYLADLLQLLEDRFDVSDFKARRPDILKEIELNGEQSFTLVRQLDIVNGLLARRIEAQRPGSAEQALAEAKRPFQLPFEYQDERIRQSLRLLQIQATELYSSFTPHPDLDVVVREKLGLSPARAAVATNDLSTDTAGLLETYGLAGTEKLADLTELTSFQAATQIDAPTLSQLLYSQLSQTASKSPGHVEREAAGLLFVNHDLSGFTSLDSEEKRLIWVKDGAAADAPPSVNPIPDAWFDRVHRLLRLSRWSGIDLITLDLILRQLCGNTLDVNALRRIGALVSLRESTKAPFDVLCAVFSELDGNAALGAGDGDDPASLFDRVFNGDAASLSKRYIASGIGYLPEAYSGWTELAATGDVLTDDGSNREFRARIQAALGISSADLTAIVTKFRDRATLRGRASRLKRIDSRSLSVLYRVVQLSNLADIAPLDMLQLIEVMESDPALKILNAFDIFYHEGVSQADFYLVLEDGPQEARSWLIQNAVAIATWAGAASLEPQDVATIACMPPADPPPPSAQTLNTPAQSAPPQDDAQRAFAQSLYDAFLPTALVAGSLQSDSIDERTARIALSTFKQPAWELVCPDDPRLVAKHPHAAWKAAHAALESLDAVTPEDMAALQFGERLASYLQTLLICRGVLDPGGVLQEDRFPARAADLVLEPDGSERFAQIFAFLNDLYTTALSRAAAAADETDAPPADDSSNAADASADPTIQDGSSTDAVGDQSSDNGSGSDASADGSDGTDSNSDASALQDGADGADATASADQSGNTGQDETDQADPQEAAQDNTAPAASDVEIYLYHSDLLKLGFSLWEADEWIERLTYLGNLDSTGMVKDPSEFSDTGNLANIQISAGVDAFRQEIHAWLAGRRDRWLDATLTLPADVWDGTRLSAAERQNLEQNLIFNQYIDAARAISDRKVVQALTPGTFELAVSFYRQRTPILEALQDVVESGRQTYLTVNADDLRPLADKFAGTDVHSLLMASCLDGQMRLNAATLAAIDQETPPFDLGPTYSAAQVQLVWSFLQQVNTAASKFRLTATAITSVGIPADHTATVFASLCADGYLEPNYTLSAKQVKHFAVVTRAQEFILPQYADYSRDVFFLIHDVAVATGAAVKALMGSLHAAAANQEQAVLAALGSQAGISAEAVEATLKPMLPDGQTIAEAIMLPVLRTAIDGVIKEPPVDRRFRALISRMTAFANLAVKLRMSPRQIEAAFRHEQLAGKLPEGIELPQGVERIDVLWSGPSGQPTASSALCAADIVNLQSLADRLNQPSRPVDEWVAAQLTPETLTALADFIEGDTNEALVTGLLRDINRLLAGASIYDAQRFSGVALRKKVQTLITQSLQTGYVPGLNRLLIEDVYADELARNEVYLFSGPRFWTYDANTLEMNAGPFPLSALSPDFTGLPQIDAIYALPNGDVRLLAGGNEWRRQAGGRFWVKPNVKDTRLWGRIKSHFENLERLEGALTDADGRIHLICGDQYVRYSNWPQDFVDEGFPRRIADHLPRELSLERLPAGWDACVNAAVGLDGEATWVFKGDSFISSAEPGVEKKIVDFWGHVRNNLSVASSVDAVLDIDGCCGIVAGDQVSVFSNGLETEGLTADEGYPRLLVSVFPNLPDAFAQRVDAGLRDADGTIHLFHEQTCATRGQDGKWESQLTAQKWGLVDNALQRTGRVDAAFAGLDGRIYVFSGEQYVRYSGSDLSRTDEGYPKAIRHDWGGLTGVEAAFVLDGKTYVFSSDHTTYLCYSTRDYTKPDDGYPKPIDDNWWNLPVALLSREFQKPDAVFVDGAGHIHLFRGGETIRFDHNHRWWSEPSPIREAWKSLPFNSVSAAFTGRDGRTYVFSNDGEPSFVRYSGRGFERIDDRFPKTVREHWGKLVNNIERTGRIDAAVTVVPAPGEAFATANSGPGNLRYLFSGDQFYRYSSEGQPFVDEGYPLRIANNLRREPHFAHLDAPAERGVDGVWADRGNVYVFIAGQMYAASTAHCRPLGGFGVEAAHAADVEEGRLTILGRTGWLHIHPPEANVPVEEAGFPRVIRTVPPAFQEQVTAILRGVDGNVYLFNEGQCYDKSLERQYPAGAVWGRVRNLIAEDSRVDSALMGRDGKLYLFRGDQFVSYTPAPETPTVIPDLADANPLPISAHWGGLQNVRHSFVHKGATYLLESPAADGSFRYVCYHGDEYKHPADAAPLSTDFSFWNIPDRYTSRGFDRVDAVISDCDGLILIRDTEFLHCDSVADIWSPPRQWAVRWPGLTRHFPDFETITAVVRVPDEKTYFFSQGSWASHDGTRAVLADITASWGRLENRLAQTNRVDATLVHDGQTFVFSGDEYVRYSDADYQYADDGYPKPIAGNLRTERPFQHLPGDLEVRFEALKPDDVWVSAAFDTGGSVYVTVAGLTYALSSRLSRTYPLQQVAEVRNELLRRAKVDAAFTLKEDRALFLLSGDQYVRYTKPEVDEVDEGYPRSIADSLLSELKGQPAKLPLRFQQDLDGAVCLKDHTLILFKHKHYVQYDPAAAELAPMEIRARWARIKNPFVATSNDPHPRIDAAFVAPSGALYVFKGNQYLRYSDPAAEYVDEGYPREIGDEWGDLPAEFKAGFDGAFVFDGRTYFSRGNRYVRYSDRELRRIDPIYPQLFTNRWRACNAFWLGDLRTIERYVSLDAKGSSANGTLTDFLLAAPAEKPDPYGLLAALWNYDAGDIEWLKRRDAFLDRPDIDVSEETDFDIALVLRLSATLQLTSRLGSYPQEVYEQVWTPCYGTPRNPAVAAAALERLIGTLYPGDNWQKIQRQLGDAVSGLLRDAQVAWLVAHQREQFADADALSNDLLTDVEMDPSIDTSPIVEAIAAVQLYFHRYLASLEPKAAAGDDVTRRPAFKQQWQWMQNYRVWEANRKVFLYPESYIQPQLRSTRTAAFQSLQQNLQQGEITNDSVTQAYKQYLDEYTTVSSLKIAGGYVCPSDNTPETSQLTLFGFTADDSPRFYFRTATFHDKDGPSSASWQDWKALGIQIKSNRVYPVRAFGRTFVFWPEIQNLPPEDTSTATLQSTTKDNTQTVTGNAKTDNCVNVMYSYHDLNGDWAPPKILTTGPREGTKIEETYVRVSDYQESGEEAVAIDYSYDLAGTAEIRALLASMEAIDAQIEMGLHLAPGTLTRPVADQMLGLLPRNKAYQLRADFTVKGIDAFPPADDRDDMRRLLFNPSEIGSLSDVIAFGSPGRSDEAPWYSFTLKGGSFLARPTGQQSLNQPDIDWIPLAKKQEGFPAWDHVDACLDGSDGTQYLFNNQSMTYAVRNDPTERAIRSQWGLRKTQILVDGKVDAAWQRDNVWFLSRGDRYLKYSRGLDWADAIGELSTETDGKADGAPSWTSISAAFTDPSKTTWFFHGSTYLTVDSNKNFGQETDIKQRWGRERNVFTSPTKGEPVVIGAFSRDGRSFLIGPSAFIAYDDAGLTLSDEPKGQSLGALLDELHCSNANDADRGATITGVADTGSELLFKVGNGAGNAVYSFGADKTVAKRPEVTPQKAAAVSDQGAAVKTATEPDPTQFLAYFVSGGRVFVFKTTARGPVIGVLGSTGQRASSQDIRAAFPAPDGSLYLFAVDNYVQLNPAEITLDGIAAAIDQWASRSAPIAGRFGRVSNPITRGGPVTAAFVRGGITFLVSDDSYFRYSDPSYDLADAGYPKPLAGNPDHLPEVSFNAPIAMPKPDGRMCYFIGTDHVFDDAFQTRIANQTRWGIIRTNILVRGVDTAYRIGNNHYLFSGNEIARYIADPNIGIRKYMEGAPVTAELGSFGSVRAAFVHGDKLYLISRDSFVCCNVADPEQPLPEYPRYGLAGALVSDLRRQFNLSNAGASSDIDPYEIYAINLQGSVLQFDTDDNTPGQRVFKLDLSNGTLSRDFSGSQATWAARRRQTEIFVDLPAISPDVPAIRYTFLADSVEKTPAGVAAVWDASHDVRSITAIWGGRPFDAAIPVGADLYLFARANCCRLPQSQAGDSDLQIVVANLRNALAFCRPIRGCFTNLPAALLDGFDASLPSGNGAYIFKGDAFIHLTGSSQLQPLTALQYDIVRLTTSTAATLNRAFFLGGAPGLLSLTVQESPETPAFSTSDSGPSLIRVNTAWVNEDTLPQAHHLDFGSANGIYLWEIFFHAPALIAGMLSTAQRFEDAKTWYQYIFDPTDPANTWKCLPFLTEDVAQIVEEIRDRLNRLEQTDVSVSPIRDIFEKDRQLDDLLDMDPAFQGERTLRNSRRDPTKRELEDILGALTGLYDDVSGKLAALIPKPDQTQKALIENLDELAGIVSELQAKWKAMQTQQLQIETYLDDPFDPHAIAALRPIAYRKAIVMAYLDNLLNWADMLFGEYSRESITEARMLYIEAGNVLGQQPQSLGRLVLSGDATFDHLFLGSGRRPQEDSAYDMLMELDNTRVAQLSFAGELMKQPKTTRVAQLSSADESTQTPDQPLVQPYFFIPPNDQLTQYWTRVADRLYKIRHGLNILGVKQPLALFEPPLNPMDLVGAVAGGGLAGLAEAGGIGVPHYRFAFLMPKAQALAQKVAQLGSELLAALEKHDAEKLARLQVGQEADILALTRSVQNAQLAEAQANLVSLQRARDNAVHRVYTYQNWLDTNYLPAEIGQITLLSVAAGLNAAAVPFDVISAALSLAPSVTVGPFSMGATEGGKNGAMSAQSIAMALQATASVLQGIAELSGISGQHERARQDWQLQHDLANYDVQQLDAQIQGANCQIQSAQFQIQIAEKQIQQNQDVSNFYRSKFTNQELYEWMIARLSDLHYRTYQLALETARAAERSFQFERGTSQSSLIESQTWDSQRKGLLAGYTLGLALDRMDAAYTATDARRFEITKVIQLIEIDPMAFLQLKTAGACEFDLGEALFDYDFPGHYCRQVKTIAVDLNMGDGIYLNATLTQLTNRVVMEPDPKAVGFLLAPKDTPPASIRTDWRPQQQIALSSHTQYETNSGVFELIFEGDRYLPFEGTGAVSRWRLELGGPPGKYDLNTLTGVTITLKYTALQGGAAFAASVRGLLKPTTMLRAFNLSTDFADLWQAFLQGDSNTIAIPMSQSLFPSMLSGAIPAVFTRYEYNSQSQGSAIFSLNYGVQVTLADGKTAATTGLAIRAAGTTLNLQLQGDKSTLQNVYLLMSYKAGTR